MAKAVASVLGSGYSGSAGTVTFVRRRDGAMVMRPRAAGRDPRTPRQEALRRVMALANKHYRDLTPDELRAWNAYAARLRDQEWQQGRAPSATGINAYRALACRVLMLDLAAEPPRLPPAAPFLGDGVAVTAEPGSSPPSSDGRADEGGARGGRSGVATCLTGSEPSPPTSLSLRAQGIAEGEGGVSGSPPPTFHPDAGAAGGAVSSFSAHEPSPAKEEGDRNLLPPLPWKGKWEAGAPPPTPSSFSAHEPSPAKEEGDRNLLPPLPRKGEGEAGTPPPTPSSSARTSDQEGVPGIVFTASGPNAPGVVTELLIQALPTGASTPRLAKYRHAGFVAFAPGHLSQVVGAPAGWVAPAYRFVLAATGQASALAELAAVRV